MDGPLKQRIVDGDLDAYAAVVREHQGMLLGYALQRLGDWTLAEEVVQLTFVRAYQNLSDFRPEEEFGVWLCVTCKYLILSELEKKRREQRNRENYRSALELEVAESAFEDEELEGPLERQVALRVCVGKLKSESADLVKRRYFAKCSCKQIAEEKGRTVSWVTSTLSLIRKKLKSCLERQLMQGGVS